jgi:cyanophycin synthetase
VIGDGVHMIEELVEIANRDPRRGDGHSNVMTRIEIDEQTEKYLNEQGLHLHVVPSRGHRVFLKRTANLSTGGTAKDVTEIAHDSIRDVAERVARVIGLDICGIDLIHDDISRPLNAQSAVIEVNAGPGLRMHVAPSEGRARDVGGAIVDMLYPPGTEARIPIASVTGTNGKTTVSRLVAHVASLSGAIVGLTCSDGIFINGRCVERGDTTGPRSARLVLSDPAIEIAVLETARGGLLRNGLGYDWSEVGVITNIRPDHIGQDGIEDLTDLIRVKSIVAERVRVGGSVILNADDPEASRVLETRNIDHKDRNVIYYSLRADHPLLRESLRHGGRAYCVKDGWICEMADADIIQIAPVSELKFTFGGTASFHISNALAAAAASRALGISREHLSRGLTTFRANFHNTGRANIYRVGRGYALLDYGHNPDALEAVGAMIRSWNPKSATAVIGLPGDRNDSLLRDCTRAVAKHFDRLILRDDHDLRGREPGEVPDLMEKVLQEEAPQVERRILLSEHSAIQAALSNLGEGELAVIFYDDFDMAASSLRTFDPIPVDEIEFVHEKVQANLESFESLEMPQASAESTNVHQLPAQRS